MGEVSPTSPSCAEARRKGEGLQAVGSWPMTLPFRPSSFTSLLDIPASASLLGRSADPSKATAFPGKSPIPSQISRTSPTSKKWAQW